MDPNLLVLLPLKQLQYLCPWPTPQGQCAMLGGEECILGSPDDVMTVNEVCTVCWECKTTTKSAPHTQMAPWTATRGYRGVLSSDEVSMDLTQTWCHFERHFPCPMALWMVPRRCQAWEARPETDRAHLGSPVQNCPSTDLAGTTSSLHR